jgi:hypothetical protein
VSPQKLDKKERRIPQDVMMLRHQHPAVSGGLEAMPRDQLDLAVINCHSAVESDAHFDQRSAQFAGTL